MAPSISPSPNTSCSENVAATALPTIRAMSLVSTPSQTLGQDWSRKPLFDIMMRSPYHHDVSTVRTTLTLDADVAAKLKAEARRTGRSYREIVNEFLRIGMRVQRATPPGPFQVHARRMGLRAGLDIDNIGELLEQIEGPEQR